MQYRTTEYRPGSQLLRLGAALAMSAAIVLTLAPIDANALTMQTAVSLNKLKPSGYVPCTPNGRPAFCPGYYTLLPDMQLVEYDDAPALGCFCHWPTPFGGVQTAHFNIGPSACAAKPADLPVGVSCLTRNWSFPSSRISIPGWRTTHGTAA